jgi:hypothetical protein
MNSELKNLGKTKQFKNRFSSNPKISTVLFKKILFNTVASPRCLNELISPQLICKPFVTLFKIRKNEKSQKSKS